jgi:coenzyme F420 hydrogenase subunit beta
MQFYQLKEQVIDAGLCTHCGTCVALTEGLQMKETGSGPLPFATNLSVEIQDAVWQACPGKGLNYAKLNINVFGKLPEKWLIGNTEKTYIGYSAKESIRYAGASGGVITQILLYLLENNLIQGAVVLKHGIPRPWLAKAIIATTSDEIIGAAQSVYAPIPVNLILDQVEKFKGILAYVGLPDQIESVRILQTLHHPAVRNIKYLIGPYVGINMYDSAILSFARSKGIKHESEIAEVKYRDGEWPGYLRITALSGKTVRAEKFYYNYLLPFYITRSTLYAINFANDFTDISVGDAWSPAYEQEGKGFAVVVARNSKARILLNDMQNEGCLELNEQSVEEIMNMHGHMFDFKKRGAFMRMRFRRFFGKKIPDYGIKPVGLGVSRYLVELIIFGVILVCSTKFSRFLLRLIPVGFIGRFFNLSRKGWKNVSKPTKRKGLLHQKYRIIENANNYQSAN